MLLDGSLRLAKILLSISHTSGFSIQFTLKLADARLHLVHGLLASLEGVHLGLVNSGREVLDLSISNLLVSLKMSRQILFSTKFFSKTSSIHHGTGSLLLGQSCLVGHLIKISIHVVDFILELPLGGRESLVSVGGISKLFIGVREVLLQLSSGSVSLLKKTSSLFKGILGSIGLSLSNNKRFLSSRLQRGLLFKLHLSISDLSLVFLQ